MPRLWRHAQLTRVRPRLALLVFFFGPAASASPRLFAEGPGSTVEPHAQSWHPEHEEDGDYGESWFFMVQAADGGLLVATLYVTNLGLRTFDAGYDVSWYGAGGEVVGHHQELRREDLSAARDELDVRAGKSRLWRDGPAYALRIEDEELTLDLRLTPELPAHQFGDGRVVLEPGRVWSLGVHAPRGHAEGSLRAGGVDASLAGYGYHDHAWSTVKLPSMLSGWRTLRVFAPRYTLVLHDQRLADEYGAGPVRFGILGANGAIAASLRDFTYAPVKTRRDPASRRTYPTELALDASGGGWRVRGTVRETRFLESVDVLGRLSWPVRTAIGALYARPFTLRYLGRYELEVTDPSGNTEKLTGEAPLEANFY